MKVKRYLANDIQEAMIKIRHELGRDAVILHSRKIKKPGIRGFFSKAVYEVVAAIDEEKPVPTKQAQPQRQAPAEPPLILKSPSSQSRVAGNEAILRERMQQQEQASAKKENAENPEIEILKKQMNSIQTALESVLTHVGGKQEKEAGSEEKDSPYKKLLEDQELTPDVINRILEVAKRQVNLSGENEKAAKNAMRIIIKDLLGAPYTIGGDSPTQKICFFVGPTGVGKTTTLAKLAARLALIDNQSVGLITADTFRIAAVEQLKTYSEILGIPLSVIYEPDEIADAIEKYKDKDYILIDTAGRSHKNAEMESDLKSLIERVQNPEIFLVMSLTTGYKDSMSILSSYQFLGDYKLLFTKLDESSSIGNILNVRLASGKPLSYFTIGQSVPDDIEIADPDKVARRLVGESV